MGYKFSVRIPLLTLLGQRLQFPIGAIGGLLPFNYEMESPSFTRFVAAVAPGTAFPGTYPLPLSEIRDQLADPALLIQLPESDILWTEPRDLTWNEAIALLAGNPRTDRWRRAILFGIISSRLNRRYTRVQPRQS